MIILTSWTGQTGCLGSLPPSLGFLMGTSSGCSGGTYSKALSDIQFLLPLSCPTSSQFSLVSELIQPLVRRLSQRDEAMSRLITESWANFVATVSILIFIIKFIIIVHFDIITIYTIASANFVISIMMVITLWIIMMIITYHFQGDPTPPGSDVYWEEVAWS